MLSTLWRGAGKAALASRSICSPPATSYRVNIIGTPSRCSPLPHPLSFVNRSLFSTTTSVNFAGETTHSANSSNSSTTSTTSTTSSSSTTSPSNPTTSAANPNPNPDPTPTPPPTLNSDRTTAAAASDAHPLFRAGQFATFAEIKQDPYYQHLQAMAPLVCITDTLEVTPTAPLDGMEAFVSNHLWTPFGARGVFGGQVIAQSLIAASKTVEDKDLHSMHCYFLLPANSQIPITYAVELVRDGSSYATRVVHAHQDDKIIFILTASYTAPPRPLPAELLAESISHAEAERSERTQNQVSEVTPSPSEDDKDEPGLTHALKFDVPHQGTARLPKSPAPYDRPFVASYQRPFPRDIIPFEKAIAEEDQWSNFLRALSMRGYDLGRRSVAIESYIKERLQSPVKIAIARQQSGKYGESRAVWLKAVLGPGETLTPNEIRAMFGYMTDFQFIGTAAVSVGLSGQSKPRLGMMASLDHTMHYYPLPPDFDPTAPLLHIMESTLVDVASGRGFVRGLLFTEQGVLIAATSQEGVVRANLGKNGPRPTREHTRLAKSKL